MITKIVNVDNHSVHYREWGNPSTPTIILLHGLAGSGASFNELCERLKDHYHLLAFDNPGHGKTAPFSFEKDYLFSSIAQFLEKVFNQALDGSFYIVGHSWGADLALHYARHFPARVKGIILLDGAFTFPQYQEDMTFEKSYHGWEAYMDESKHASWESVVKEYKTYTSRWNETIEEVVAVQFIKNDQFELIASKFTVLSIIKAFFKEPFFTSYPYIEVPVLMIYAKDPAGLDEARELGIRELKDHIRDVELVQLTTGHMVHWDAPDAVAQCITRWLKTDA